MQVNILIFGQLTDIIGVSKLTLKDISTSDELMGILVQRYPALAHVKYVVALDKKVINENTQLLDDSTVALLPPFSGG
jgi:molybdopterin synthase sulfur carrier subunit